MLLVKTCSKAAMSASMRLIHLVYCKSFPADFYPRR